MARGRPKYRFCKVCQFEAKTCQDREDHVKKAHGKKMDLRYPKQWFLQKRPTPKEMEKHRRRLLTVRVEKGKYSCAFCNNPLNKRTIHDHYVREIANMFHEKGFKVIIEGKIPREWFQYRGQWHEPDVFILQNSKLVKIVEVVVADPYENGKAGVTVYSKCKTVRDYYNPREIIVFEPTDYLDKVHLPETKYLYTKDLGYEPTSYEEIQRFYAKKWKEEGLNVVFWNEENLKQILKRAREINIEGR